jgi:hypothetical protein
VMICTEAEVSAECSDMRGKLYLSRFFYYDSLQGFYTML